MTTIHEEECRVSVPNEDWEHLEVTVATVTDIDHETHLAHEQEIAAEYRAGELSVAAGMHLMDCAAQRCVKCRGIWSCQRRGIEG